MNKNKLDTIIEELDKKRDISINKKKRALLKDEVSTYRLEEQTLDYVLFRIRDLIGNFVIKIKYKKILYFAYLFVPL
jgi:hypothetical protein